MKQIGVTNEGNPLIEMTVAEWRLLEVSGHGETNLVDRLAWQQTFLETFTSLPLSTRTKQTLCRAVTAGNDIVFKPHGERLPFATWARATLAGDIHVLRIRGFGRGMRTELDAALRNYLAGEL